MLVGVAYGSGPYNNEERIRIRENNTIRIRMDPDSDPQHCVQHEQCWGYRSARIVSTILLILYVLVEVDPDPTCNRGKFSILIHFMFLNFLEMTSDGRK